MLRNCVSIIGRMLLATAILPAWIEPHRTFAQAKPLTKVRLATSTAGLDFAPIWIAQRKGYFKEEGIDFEHILTTGGAVTMAAPTN